MTPLSLLPKFLRLPSPHPHLQVGVLAPYVVFDVERGRESSHSRSRRNAAEADMAAALFWDLR